VSGFDLDAGPASAQEVGGNKESFGPLRHRAPETYQAFLPQCLLLDKVQRTHSSHECGVLLARRTSYASLRMFVEKVLYGLVGWQSCSVQEITLDMPHGLCDSMHDILRSMKESVLSAVTEAFNVRTR
jgi:hypothetical protein